MTLRPARHAIGLLLACGALSPLAAQTLRGRVLLPDSLTGVEGITVLLRGADGSIVRRVASSADGSFVIVPGIDGRVTAEALRLGYQPTRRELVIGSTDIAIDLVLTAQPVELAAVQVTDRARCRMRGAAREEFLTIWAQARRALLQAMPADDSSIRIRALSVNATEDGETRLGSGRRVPPDPANVMHEVDSSTAWVSVASAFPFRSSASTLSRQGYIRADGRGAHIYDGPSTEDLLSESFAARHCFSIERPRSRERAGWVGIRFRDAETVDTVADIEGTLWLTASGDLAQIDFVYVNARHYLPQAYVVGREPRRYYRRREIRGIGGTITFAYATTGQWIPARWTIRSPTSEEYERYAGFKLRAERRETVECYDNRPGCNRHHVPVPRLHVASGAIADVVLKGQTVYSSEEVLAAIARVSRSAR